MIPSLHYNDFGLQLTWLISEADADSHRISMAMTTLQNPVKDRLDAITNDLKDVTKAQRSFGKALGKVRL